MAITTKTPVRTVFDASNAAVGLAEFQTDEVIPISHGGTSGNSISSAKLALSLTDSNIRSLFSVSGSGTYSNTTGIITVTGGVTSVGGATGTVSNAQVAAAVVTAGSLDTANVTERNNLYFTNARSQGAFTAGTGITISDGIISVASALDYGLIDGAVTSSNDYGSI